MTKLPHRAGPVDTHNHYTQRMPKHLATAESVACIKVHRAAIARALEVDHYIDSLYIDVGGEG